MGQEHRSDAIVSDSEAHVGTPRYRLDRSTPDILAPLVEIDLELSVEGVPALAASGRIVTARQTHTAEAVVPHLVHLDGRLLPRSRNRGAAVARITVAMAATRMTGHGAAFLDVPLPGAGLHRIALLYTLDGHARVDALGVRTGQLPAVGRSAAPVYIAEARLGSGWQDPAQTQNQATEPTGCPHVGFASASIKKAR